MIVNVTVYLHYDCFPCVEKYPIKHKALIISGSLYLDMKSIHLKKIHHDYTETPRKTNGINMIKGFGTIHCEITDTVYNSSKTYMTYK